MTPLLLNLNNRSWGLFLPQRNIARHYFLIGQTYSFLFDVCSYIFYINLHANALKHPQTQFGVKKKTPQDLFNVIIFWTCY